jgi:hypothetical protein
MQTTNTLGNWILPDHGIGPRGHQQPHSTLTDILSQSPADMRPQPTRKAQKQTRLQTLSQVNHDDPLPREAFLMVTAVKKLNDREAEFCRKSDGKAEVDRDGRWIRKFDSLPMHLRHDMLNSRLLVRAELEGANAMRDIIIARTEYVSQRHNLQVQVWKSYKSFFTSKCHSSGVSDGNTSCDSCGLWILRCLYLFLFPTLFETA